MLNSSPKMKRKEKKKKNRKIENRKKWKINRIHYLQLLYIAEFGQAAWVLGIVHT